MPSHVPDVFMALGAQQDFPKIIRRAPANQRQPGDKICCTETTRKATGKQTKIRSKTEQIEDLRRVERKPALIFRHTPAYSQQETGSFVRRKEEEPLDRNGNTLA